MYFTELLCRENSNEISLTLSQHFHRFYEDANRGQLQSLSSYK